MIKLIFSLSTLSFIGYALGFVNQIIIANKFGTSPELDIYLLTASVVNFGWLFIGPINEVSIPDFFNNFKKSNIKGSIYFSKVLNIILILSVVMSFSIFIFLSNIFEYVSPGNTINYQKFRENSLFLLPIITLTAITQYFQFVLNSLSKYIAQSIGKIITASISVLFLLFYFNYLGIKAIIFGMEIGLIILMFLQYYFITNLKISYYPFVGFFFRISYYKNIAALLFTYIISALQLVYEKFVFMSFGEGILSSYNYSQALLQVPQMIVLSGVVAIVSTNFMNQIHKNNIDLGLDNLYNISINSFIIAMFVAITTSIFSKEIVFVLFYRGMFNSNSFENTSFILNILIFAFPFIVVSNILGRVLVVLKKINILFWINIFSALTSILFLFIAYKLKNILFAIVTMVILIFLIVLFKLIIYRGFYIEKKAKSILSLQIIFKITLILFSYGLFLHALKYFLDINYATNKFKLILKLIFIGFVFTFSISAYFKLFKIKKNEKDLPIG